MKYASLIHDNGLPGMKSLSDEPRKTYIDEKYGIEEAKKKSAEWDKLMQQLFVRRK